MCALVQEKQGKYSEAEKSLFRCYTILCITPGIGVEHRDTQRYFEEMLNIVLRRGDDATAEKFALTNYTSIKDGRTALHNAAYYGHKDICCLLLEKGADLTAIDKEGDTAEQVARVCGHTATADMLRDWTKPSQPPAKPSAVDSTIQSGPDAVLPPPPPAPISNPTSPSAPAASAPPPSVPQ